MDWGNDYFTFSDTNIEYVWRLLKRRARARLALHGPPLDRVVPALRHVDLAARARSGSYVDRADPSLYVRFPLARPRRRVARDLDDDAVDAAGERRRRRQPGRASTAGARTASGSPSRAIPTRRSRSGSPARELVGWRYHGPVRRARGRPASSTASSRGTRSRSTRAPASSTSRRAAAPRTSSSRACTTCRC